MAGELEATQVQLRDEVPDVERVSGGIEAAIQRDRPVVEALGQRIQIGAVGDEAAPAEVFKQGHAEGKVTEAATRRARAILILPMRSLEMALLPGKTVCRAPPGGSS